MYQELQNLQLKHLKWTIKNFGKRPGWHPLLGIGEEVGELMHHYLKREQGIRNSEPHSEEIRDAVGDIVMYLLDFCSCEGISLAACIDEVSEKVHRRDWISNPDDAYLEK